MRCPLCNTELPDGSVFCTRCDWVKPDPPSPERNARDWAALWLSMVVPGLGHLYKGHVLLGALIFFVIGPCVLALGLAVMPATLGLSLVLPAAFMALVMMHAYQADDRRAEVIRKARELDRLRAGAGHE